MLKDSWGSLLYNLTKVKIKTTPTLKSEVRRKQKSKHIVPLTTIKPPPHCSCTLYKISVQKNGSFMWIFPSPMSAPVIPVAAMLQLILLVDPAPVCGSVVFCNFCNLVTRKGDVIVPVSGLRRTTLLSRQMMSSIGDITLVTSVSLV